MSKSRLGELTQSQLKTAYALASGAEYHDGKRQFAKDPGWEHSMYSYPIIQSCHLPDDVETELANDAMVNDCGVIINTEYHPRFRAWLESLGMPVTTGLPSPFEAQCYIVWWSW